MTTTRSHQTACSASKTLPDLDPADSTIALDFGCMLDSGARSDVEFVLASGKRVAAHRQILAARSEVFLRMFSGGYMEGTTEDAGIAVSDIEDDVFQAFLKFVYTGIVDASFFAPRNSTDVGAGGTQPSSSSPPNTTSKKTLGKRKRVSRRSSVGSAASMPSCEEDNGAIDADRVVKLLAVADKYAVRRLRNHCEDMLNAPSMPATPSNCSPLQTDIISVH